VDSNSSMSDRCLTVTIPSNLELLTYVLNGLLLIETNSMYWSEGPASAVSSRILQIKLFVIFCRTIEPYYSIRSSFSGRPLQCI
jgi:hypothetical protein